MSKRGEVAERLQQVRTGLLQAGYLEPAGLVRKALDFLSLALKGEKLELTAAEMIQVAGLFAAAAEGQLARDATGAGTSVRLCPENEPT